MGMTSSLMIDPAAAGRSSGHGAGQRSGRWLGGRRSLVIGGALIATAAAVALSQDWLGLVDLIPLLYVLPCAAMMFMCMKGHSQQTDTAAVAARPETPTAPDTRT